MSILQKLKKTFSKRKVLTFKEARRISDSSVKGQVKLLLEECQKRIEESCICKEYSVTIDLNYDYDVYHQAGEILISRGFSVKIFKRTKAKQLKRVSRYYMIVSWSREEDQLDKTNNG